MVIDAVMVYRDRRSPSLVVAVPRFSDTEILFVGLKPSLVRILERRGKRGHDLAAIAQIATDLRPFLGLANRLKATTSLDSLFELEQIQGTLVDAGESVEVCAVLLVKFGQLVEVIQIRTGSWGPGQTGQQQGRLSMETYLLQPS